MPYEGGARLGRCFHIREVLLEGLRQGGLDEAARGAEDRVGLGFEYLWPHVFP